MSHFLGIVAVEKITSMKDNTWRILLNTQDCNDEESGRIASLKNKICCIYLKQGDTQSIPEEVMKEIDDSVNDLGMKGKTQSKRIYNTLYRLWQEDNKGFTEFENYYKNRTEEILNNLKKEFDLINARLI